MKNLCPRSSRLPLRTRAIASLVAAMTLALSPPVLAACQGPPSRIWAAITDSGKRLPMEYELKEVGDARVLEARGTIGQNEAQRFKEALNRAGHVDEVWLFSAGGVSVQGVEIGRLMRQRGLAVRVPRGAACFSACSMAFLGGVLRSVDPGGFYGVHMWTSWSDERTEVLTEAVADLIKKNMPTDEVSRQLRKIIQSIERQNAEYARQRANYLIEMSVSLQLMIPNVQTESGDAHWLCPDEMRRYNVTNH
jgi:hypothetical protein